MSAEPPPHDLPLPIDRYRSYLHLLPRAQLDGAVRARLDASDIVQQSMLEAHRDRKAFRGSTPGEQAAWLRRILAHNLANALRDLRRAKRDIGKERSLDQSLDRALDASAPRIEGWLAADQPTPSELVDDQQRMLRLADEVSALPEDQQQAIVLRYWQALSLAEIAERMERTPASVAGLLHRGLSGLRQTLRQLERRH